MVLENTMCRRREQQDTTKLPFITFPISLIALFLICLIILKTPFRVKIHHASMSTSATLASTCSLSSRWCGILMTYTPLTSVISTGSARRSVVSCFFAMSPAQASWQESGVIQKQGQDGTTSHCRRVLGLMCAEMN